VAGVYAGQALTFPWMTDAMKTPCGKTALEWAIAENSIRQDEPVQLGDYFDLAALACKPSAKGLLVRAECRRRPGYIKTPRDQGWHRAMDIISRKCLDISKERFGTDGAFDGWRNLYLVLVLDGRVTVVRTFSHMKLVPPDVPENVQNAAIAEMLAVR